MNRTIKRNESELKVKRATKALGNQLAEIAKKYELFPIEVQIVLHELQEDILNLMYNRLFDEKGSDNIE